VTTPENTEVTEGVQLVDTPGPDEPVRFSDPKRNAAYWERIRRIVDEAPPLTTEQKAILRTLFHQPTTREAA
jgi:hypothetical protein